MKKINKIVLTGGPCAGKTTLISKINQIFPSLGYRVFTINETATELITKGLKPFGDCIDLLNFQDFVFDTQYNKEKMYELAASLVPEEKVLIICDRGLLDNKAYINDELFTSILKRRNLKENQIKNNYNAIIHLVTAAKGAEDAYNLDNIARTESIEDAINLDNKTLNAWIGHPRLKVIDNRGSFDKKMDKAINEIFSILGEPIPIESQRKFLVKIPDMKEFPYFKKDTIIQTYLNSKPGEERRIRQKGISGDFVYFYTEKKKISDSEYAKIERTINVDEYLDLLSEADNKLNQVIKTRYSFTYESQYFEFDIYPSNQTEGLLEIKLTQGSEEVNIPKSFSIIDDVSYNNSYSNYNISKMNKF